MSVFDAYVRLDGTVSGTVASDEEMARHTSYRIGGPAALFVSCNTVADLALTCDVLLEEEVKWVILGKGTNVLVSDQGFDGAVIVLGEEFATADFGDFDKRSAENPVLEMGQEYTVNVGAAAPFARVVQSAFGYGLSGLEFAVGIPGTIGGALFMNAGSRSEWIGSRVSTVTSYRPGSGLKITRANELAWGYRTSGLPADEIIVEATLIMHAKDKESISNEMQARLDERTKSQPLTSRSCGSVFKNPEGGFAAQLIADCGLVGASCNDAQISTQHANFIVNNGDASADDVLALIHLARSRVKEIYGISLRPEVKFLGFPF